MIGGKKPVSMLWIIAAVLVTGGVAAACAKHEDPPQVSRALDSTDDVTSLIAQGDVNEARNRFFQTHSSFHSTAVEVRDVDPSIAEVVDDFTEALKARLTAPGSNQQALLDIVSRTRAWLEAAHLALDGTKEG